jgi:hypothetical protein
LVDGQTQRVIKRQIRRFSGFELAPNQVLYKGSQAFATDTNNPHRATPWRSGDGNDGVVVP